MNILKKAIYYLRQPKAGQKFGMLTVIQQFGWRLDERAYFCKCRCGNFCFRTAKQLRGDYFPNCGCLDRYTGGRNDE